MKKVLGIVLSAFLLAACGSGNAAAGTPSVSPESTPAEAVKQEDSVSYDAEIIRFEVTADDYGTTELNAIVSVTNTGTANLYIGSNNKFAINDASGHLIASEDFLNVCRDIIAPGETGYVYTFYSSLPDGTDPDASYSLDPQLDIEQAYGEGITDYEVTDTGMSQTSWGTPSVTGRLTNNTEEDIDYLYITAIFKDAEGNILGIEGTSITEVAAGAETTFQIDSLKKYSSDPASAEIVARKEHYQF